MSGERPQRRLRFVCMMLNAAGRPVPMFDPFCDAEPADEPAEAAGPIERLLFGLREDETTAHTLPRLSRERS